jgi:hypothetical protein
MKVRIVCYEEVDAWILGKFARRLNENLRLQGVDVDIAKTPDASADINHHIIYFDYDGRKTTTETVMITHIDTDWKVDRVRQQVIEAEMGVCMSADTLQQLVRKGVPRHKLCYINPAHDDWVRPRKKLIGITSKVQPSGCKREEMLLELAGRIAADDFKFFIMGGGWSSIVDSLRKLGIEVDHYDRFDDKSYRQILPSLDYYLYFGQDEGSMGFLDALSAGVPTIVTPQGFHLDAINGITYPFNDLRELVKIFHEISEQTHRLRRSVQDWTWAEYARKHLVLWEYLLGRKSSQPVPGSQLEQLQTMSVAQQPETLSSLKSGVLYGIHKMSRIPRSLRRRLSYGAQKVHDLFLKIRRRTGRIIPHSRTHS